MVQDEETIKIFTRYRLEDSLLEFLQNNKYDDKILSQVFKIIVIMHVSTNILNLTNEVGDLFVEKGGLKLLIELLDLRTAEDRINWHVLERLLQCLFVFCFKDKNVRTLKQDNILKRLVDTLIKGVEVRRMEVVMQIIKTLTFFSDDQITWSQIICRDVIKGCLMCISTRDAIEKKFILALLNDITLSPIAMKIIKEMPWTEGMGKIINQAFVFEPVAVSFIIGNLNKDVVVRNQLLTMMPREYVGDILMAKEDLN